MCKVDNLVQITVDLHRCEVESVSLRVHSDRTDSHPQLSAAWYLCFKERLSLKGLPKISWVTDNLCLEIKAGLKWQALPRRLWWQSQYKEECGARETDRDGQRVSEAVMPFIQGG